MCHHSPFLNKKMLKVSKMGFYTFFLVINIICKCGVPAKIHVSTWSPSKIHVSTGSNKAFLSRIRSLSAATVSNNLVKYLIMAYALVNNNERPIKTAAIFADSYLRANNFESRRWTTSHLGGVLELEPHSFNFNGQNGLNSAHIVSVRNFASSSMTMDRQLNTYVNIAEWADSLPHLSIVHLGACDLANTGLNAEEKIGKAFIDKVFNFLEQLKTIGRNAAHDRAKFDRQLPAHQFLIIGVPDWGSNFGPPHRNSLNEEQFKLLRGKVNKGLNYPHVKKALWKKHRAVVFMPRMEHFTMDRVHPTAESKAVYGDQILAVAAKLLCDSCQLKSSFDEKEHKSEKLKEDLCRGNIQI